MDTLRTSSNLPTYPILCLVVYVPARTMTCQYSIYYAISVVIMLSLTRSRHLSFGLPRVLYQSTTSVISFSWHPMCPTIAHVRTSVCISSCLRFLHNPVLSFLFGGFGAVVFGTLLRLELEGSREGILYDEIYITIFN